MAIAAQSTSVGPETIRALEERAFNAWPARQSVLHGGWVFRLSGGFTKRANSVNALASNASFSGVRAAAEALYARHGLPPVFRISPLAPTTADQELADAGYTHFDPSLVMATAGLDAAQAHACVQIETTPTAAWLDGFAAANGVAAQNHAVHHAMVHAIALPCAFATLHDGAGRTIGFGLAVLERGPSGSMTSWSILPFAGGAMAVFLCARCCSGGAMWGRGRLICRCGRSMGWLSGCMRGWGLWRFMGTTIGFRR